MYSEYQMNLSDALDKFLSRSPTSSKPLRTLTPAEFEMVATMSKLYRDMNTLLTQLITIRTLIAAMNDRPLRAINGNICRIIHSVTKQRDKIHATKATFAVICPTPFEIKAIEELINKSITRIEFLEQTIIPENLILTPIYDYLQVKNLTFKEEIKTRFTTQTALIDAMHDKETLTAYVTEIMDTIFQTPNANAYQARLDQYLHARDMKNNTLSEQYEQRDIETRRNAMLHDYMTNFQSAIYDSVSSLHENIVIGIREKGLRSFVNANGRKAAMLLCCYMNGDRPVYKYVTIDGKITEHLTHRCSFKTKTQAEQVKTICSAQYPKRLFDIITLI